MLGKKNCQKQSFRLSIHYAVKGSSQAFKFFLLQQEYYYQLSEYNKFLQILKEILPIIQRKVVSYKINLISIEIMINKEDSCYSQISGFIDDLSVRAYKIKM
ncbi:hypothetical protein pb186bvf_010474 [Paramecium bursaria]